ncbi:bacteriohemerythrin [Geobacter argillaceus]|uniref:Methyl-accepting chemotaxis protein/hemerythrin n=1 Tax=Geobacter argillaceus TaxID=345631 RepID=A0A562VK64_9BACT|nr:bacteriohemerythrin [Geobacter argillaceus]TWJ18245.1 methyl-accepting chemotaxis protein/hemerythrin [Geobacter argillaceus]
MFSRVTIGTKIIGIVGAILGLLILIGLVSLAKLSNVAAVADEIGRKEMPGVTILAKIGNNVDTYRRSELQFYLKNTEEDFKRYHDRMGKMQEEIKSSLEAYKKLPLADEEKRHLAAFDAAWPPYVTNTANVDELVKAGQLDEAQKLTRGEGKKLYDEANKTLGVLQAFNQKEADEGLKRVDALTAAAQIWIVVIIVSGLLFGLLLALMAVRSIRAPLQRLAADAEQIATGDLGVEVRVDSNDEVGQLARSFEKMVNSLRELIGRLADSSAEVSKSSVDMQSNSEQMATGAEEVAAQAVTVATASEEMSATSGDIAQNCMLAAESAKRANDAADHGATVVEKSIAVMKRIADRVKSSASTVTELGQKSDQIGAIVDTIQDIADQTNLLALNAAIEAARAGEQGRGFAVVADEVRALAERTTKATKEISEMIKVIQRNTQTAVSAMEEGVAEVHNGTDEAERSGEALRRIQDEINAVNLQVQQIATAAEEQTATTSEITGNMHQITEVVSGSVDRARDTYNAAQHLSRLSEELQRVVGQFKLAESGNLITWSSSYSVHVSQMDEEHQRLVSIINKLYGAMREGRGKEAVGSILGELIDYTKNHFAHEERLMQETGFAGLEEQKRAHENLISRVSEIQKKFKAGEALSQEVMSFLKDWLSNHIQGQDKQYGPHLNSKGIK